MSLRLPSLTEPASTGLSQYTEGSNSVATPVPVRPSPLPERDVRPAVDTIWFDLSVRLILFQHISGITRTIERLYWHIRPNRELDVRYCVVLPGKGFGEVDPEWLAAALAGQSNKKHEKEISAENLVSPSIPDLPALTNKEKKKRSRFGFVPYPVRHGLRSWKSNLNNWWREPEAPPPPPPSHPFQPYPVGAVKRLVELGQRDLFLSLGGQWIVAGTDTTLLQQKRAANFQHASLIYDMIPTYAPHMSPNALSDSFFTQVTHNQLLSSDLIFTISEYSKKEILQYCAEKLIPPPPVEVFYLGSDIPGLETARPAPPAPSTAPFILTVGSVEIRKNQFFLYYVWRALLAKYGPEKTPKLVVAGKLGWLGNFFFEVAERDPVVKKHIMIRPDPTDQELNWLYRHCQFTVYPSTYEGWGLPVEESLVYGKLCITTTASSLPEVGGDFVDYVPPESLEQLTAAVEKAMDPEYRAGRERHIREKFRPHTWDRAGTQVKALLNRYFDIRKPE